MSSILPSLTPFRVWHDYSPGVLCALLVAVAATFVSERYGGPQFLYALFFGIAFNFLASNPRTRQGVDFSARTILRVGVALLGARITFEQIASLGAVPVVLVIVAVMATIAFGAWLARIMGRPMEDGLLTGGAVAICGASAALAISAVLPRSERMSRHTLLTVVGVTLLSTVAMIVYPAIVGLLNFDDRSAGIFLGGTIHDVAQVVGAGYIISQRAGDNATFVKLLRVTMLLPTVLCFSVFFRQKVQSGARPPLLPWFLLVFAVLVVAGSLGLLAPQLVSGASSVSRWCLVTAISALGIKTAFADFVDLSWRPIVLMISETLFLCGLVLIVLLLLRHAG